MAKPSELAEAFEIFAKYSDEKYPLHAEHDKISVHVNPKDVDQEDEERLEEIGFHANKGSGIPDFYYFT